MADRLILAALTLAALAAAATRLERQSRPIDHRHPTTSPRSIP